MPVFVGLLRGVNVGGNILKMDRLREVCAKLGAKNSRTYVQSGNVVFEGAGTAVAWEAKLEKALAGESRLPVSVIVRTSGEMQKVFAGNPFLKEKGIEIIRLGVTFLKESPSQPARAALAARDFGRARFHLAGKDVYLHCPDGFGNSKLYLLDKLLKQPATTRNWNTVGRVCAMCSE